MKGAKERLVVELDHVASKMLRRHINGRTHFRRDGDDPRAVASAAVVWLLGDDCESGEVLAEAVARNERLHGKPVVRCHPPIAVDIDVEAAKLLARYVKDTGQDARDVASGMLYSMLARALWDESYNSAESIESARARRLSRAERIKPTGKKASAGQPVKRGGVA